jgi:hypothetical protein
MEDEWRMDEEPGWVMRIRQHPISIIPCIPNPHLANNLLSDGFLTINDIICNPVANWLLYQFIDYESYRFFPVLFDRRRGALSAGTATQ